MERINKLENGMQVESGRPQKKYRITLTDTETGEIMYQWESYGGIGCSIEKVTAFGAELEGVHQVFGWGHPMVTWYGLDQVTKWFHKNGEAFVDTCIATGAIKGDGEFLKNLFRKKS